MTVKKGRHEEHTTIGDGWEGGNKSVGMIKIKIKVARMKEPRRRLGDGGPRGRLAS